MDINGLLSFQKVNPPQDLIDTIWTFDVHNLESTPDITISKYTVALGQWLIYYRSQTNMLRAEINKKQSDLDFVIATVITPSVAKEYGTKTAAVAHLMQTDSTINKMDKAIDKLKNDIIMVDGIDKAVGELIAAFKRELSRRENELYTTRRERYGS